MDKVVTQSLRGSVKDNMASFGLFWQDAQVWNKWKLTGLVWKNKT